MGQLRASAFSRRYRFSSQPPLLYPLPLPKPYFHSSDPLLKLEFKALALSGQLARIVDQFYHRHLGIVALAAAEFDDAGVSAVTVFIAHTELIEKPLDGFYAGGSFDRLFFLALFAAKPALLSFKGAVAGMEITGSLATQVDTAKHRVIAGKAPG